MNEGEILERLKDLEEQRQKAIAVENAISGAMQDCEWWLEKARAVGGSRSQGSGETGNKQTEKGKLLSFPSIPVPEGTVG
jgi:hypothetical protein